MFLGWDIVFSCYYALPSQVYDSQLSIPYSLINNVNITDWEDEDEG